IVALEQRYCNRKPRCVMARPGESLKNNNAEIWRETHLSRASEGPKRTGSSNTLRSTDESVRTLGPCTPPGRIFYCRQHFLTPITGGSRNSLLQWGDYLSAAALADQALESAEREGSPIVWDSYIKDRSWLVSTWA